MNTTMDKLAVGAIFQHGHDRDGKGNRWVKVSNRLARRVGDPDSVPPTPNAQTSAEEAHVANLDVTYLGSSRTLQ